MATLDKEMAEERVTQLEEEMMHAKDECEGLFVVRGFFKKKLVIDCTYPNFSFMISYLQSCG